jgi:putative OPT family oligopeptide transporter
VLDLLNTSYGFVGAPGAGENALAAPQAGLISALATGVLGGGLNWEMIYIGAAIGVAACLVDELFGRLGWLRLPPLAVGIGIYLPITVTLLVVIGAVLGKLYDNWADRTADPERRKRMGVLMATGLIVGDGLLNVAFAGVVAASGSPDKIALVGDTFEPYAIALGLALFVALLAFCYRKAMRASA